MKKLILLPLLFIGCASAPKANDPCKELSASTHLYGCELNFKEGGGVFCLTQPGAQNCWIKNPPAQPAPVKSAKDVKTPAVPEKK
jgi:hypothetical protein